MVKKKETQLGLDEKQAVALAHIINDAASTGSIENSKTPKNTSGQNFNIQNKTSSQMSTKHGTMSQMGHKKINNRFAEMRVEV